MQLLHEAAHGLLSYSKRANYRAGNWLCGLPIGVMAEGYTFGHMQHHSYIGTPEDPKSDTEKYKITDVRDPKLYRLFLKDILGITALMTFFAYGDNERAVVKNRMAGEKSSRLIFILQLFVVQTLILGAVFQFNVVHYILFWVYPAMGPHMFLMRIRGIAEHGLPRQLGVSAENKGAGTYYTRSFLTPVCSYKFVPFQWIEKALIGSFEVYYHHEHHLLPKVPFYNLKKVHAAIRDRVVESNPETYVRGYFSAAFRSVLEKA